MKKSPPKTQKKKKNGSGEENKTFSEKNDIVNPLSASFTKWSNTLKQFVSFCRLFGHFVGLTLKGF